MRLFSQRKIFTVILAALFVLIISSPFGCSSKKGAPPESAPITVEAEVDKTRSTVGDTVTYTVTITHSADTEVSAPVIPAPESSAFEGFEFVEKGSGKPHKVDGRIVREFWYRLRADLVGQYTFPAFRINFSLPDAKGRKTPGQTAAPKVDAEILSVLHLRGEPTDIHGIKPLTKVSKDWYPYALIVLGFLALASLAKWARSKWRGKSRPSSEDSGTAIILNPHELALKNLNQLLAKQLIEKERYREYNFELSEIFRRYLGSRYSFPAIDWTTEEISAWLHETDILKEGQRQAACAILINTDRIKFAKGETDAEASMGDMRSIKQFVNLTMENEITTNQKDLKPATGLDQP